MSWLSVAVKSFTGMLTIPKLMVPRQIARAAMGLSCVLQHSTLLYSR
jgi:hypothetical protein